MENLYKKWFDALNTEQVKTKAKTMVNEIASVCGTYDEADANFFMLWKKDPDGNPGIGYFSFHLYPLDGYFDPIDTCWIENDQELAFNELLRLLESLIETW